MKTKCILFLLVCLSITGFAQKKVQTWYDGEKTKLREIYEASSEPPYLINGNYKMYSRSTKIEKDYNYINGELNGLCIDYNEGVITKKCNYKMGKKNGEEVFYYPNGKVERQFKYIYDLTDGPCSFYYSDGQLKYSGAYKSGKQDGPYTAYFPSGKLEWTSNYIDGKENGIKKTYYPSGSVKGEYTFVSGKADGITKEYSENGTVISEVNFKGGLANGITKTYYASGKIENEYTLLDGKQTGPFKIYYESGTLQMEGTLTNGEFEGIRKVYYPNGALGSETYYVDGKKSGKRIMRSRSGKIESNVVYQNDQMKDGSITGNGITQQINWGKDITYCNEGFKSRDIDVTEGGVGTLMTAVDNTTPKTKVTIGFVRENSMEDDTMIVNVRVDSKDSFCVLGKGHEITFITSEGKFKYFFPNSPAEVSTDRKGNSIRMGFGEFERISKNLNSIQVRCRAKGVQGTDQSEQFGAFGYSSQEFMTFDLSKKASSNLENIAAAIVQ